MISDLNVVRRARNLVKNQYSGSMFSCRDSKGKFTEKFDKAAYFSPVGALRKVCNEYWLEYEKQKRLVNMLKNCVQYDPLSGPLEAFHLLELQM